MKNTFAPSCPFFDTHQVMKKRSVIVCGPQGCGKTRNKEVIAKALGLGKIVDDWEPGMDLPAYDTLMLCSHIYPVLDGYIVISYEDAMMCDSMQGMEVQP